MKNTARFKFNSGLGALLCSGCSKIIKIGAEMSVQEREAMMGNITLQAQYCDECKGKPLVEYTLERKDDGLVHKSYQVHYVEWTDKGRFQKLHDKPQVGFSCILDAHSAPYYTWLTTQIKEILEDTEEKLVFKTRNSLYELTWQTK